MVVRRGVTLPSSAAFALLRPGQFSEALKKRAVLRSDRFALHLGPPPAISAGPEPVASGERWNLGLAVPKRYERSAVRRNAVKRVWREAFLRYRPRFAGLPPQSLIVRLVKPVTEPAGRPSLASLKRICRTEAELLLDKLSARFR